MKSNLVGIKGVAIEDLLPQEDINGTRYKCWRMAVSTDRKSGTADEVIVFATEETEESELLPFIKGENVLITGKLQTAKNFKTGHVLTYVLADFIGLLPKTALDHENAVELVGTIAKGTKFRVTPQGKHITSFMLEVSNTLRQSNCYIPCIAWGSVADELKDWEQGAKVAIQGRLQSRNYVKKTEDGEIESTAHEVSANTVHKIEENTEQTPAE